MSALLDQMRGHIPRIAETTLRRARLGVVRRPPTQASKAPFVTVVVLLLAGGMLGLLVLNTSMQQASFHADDLQEKAARLQAREQALTMRLADIRDPQGLARRARDLGMVPGPAPAYLRLPGGKVVGAPKRATAHTEFKVAPPRTARPDALRPDPVVVHPGSDR